MHARTCHVETYRNNFIVIETGLPQAVLALLRLLPIDYQDSTHRAEPCQLYTA